MKANELMINDWVRVKRTQKIVKVKEIKQSCIYTEDNGYEYNEIEPIPLTKEILEKNGWKKLETAYWWRGGGIPILLDMYDERYGWCLSIERNHIPFDCKYVHQLQQAMSLCGITKEIEL